MIDIPWRGHRMRLCWTSKSQRNISWIFSGLASFAICKTWSDTSHGFYNKYGLNKNISSRTPECLDFVIPCYCLSQKETNYLDEGTGYDWAGQSNRRLYPLLLCSWVNLSFSLSFGATLPTGSRNNDLVLNRENSLILAPIRYPVHC